MPERSHLSVPSADRLGARFPDWVPLQGGAVVRATVLTLAVLGLFVALQGAVHAIAVSGGQPMAVTDQVPAEPGAATWQDAPARTVDLQKQRMALPYGGGSVDQLQVQALTNDSHVAVRLTWEDPTNDTEITAPEKYSDAAAVMLRGGSQPPITMGATGEPVDIWYWRSAWQYGGDDAEWTGDMYAYPHNDTLTKPGQQAGNPLSKAHYEQSAQNYYAKGFGSLSAAPTQNVDATARRTDGQWQVTFVRERTGEGTYDADFRSHDRMYLAFAVWNGSADEVNGQKSITLRFSTLDTESGELSAPASSGGGSDGASGSDGGTAASGGAPSDGGSSGDGGPFSGPMFRYITFVVGVALVTWTVAYWRVRE